MTALLSVEVRRFLARRAVRFMVGLAVLAILVAGSILFVKSHRLDPARRRELIARAEANLREQIQACVSGRFGITQDQIPPGETLEQFCAEVIGPERIEDPGFHLTKLHDVYLGTSPMLIALFVVLGASFIGAEWHAGTMTTLLTWEPRRVRVFAAKMLAAAALAFLGILALQAFLGGVLAASAIFRGTTEGANAAWFRSIGGLLLRAAAVGAAGAAMAAGLATIGRNTAAALGVAFGYIAVIEPILHAVRPKWEPWFLYDNAATFVMGNRSGFPTIDRSTVGAGLVLAAYAAALLLVAGVMFARRDVT
jgi:ABC-2 type transport system permease protein